MMAEVDMNIKQALLLHMIQMKAVTEAEEAVWKVLEHTVSIRDSGCGNILVIPRGGSCARHCSAVPYLEKLIESSCSYLEK